MTPADSGLPQCLRKPIPEIAQAALLLQQAVDAHLVGFADEAARLIASTNTEIVRKWVESLWGQGSPYVVVRAIPDAPPTLSRIARVPIRMPTAAEQARLVAEQGRRCRFCGVPLIRVQVRRRLHALYPGALPWGRKNTEQHAAFQAMWLQYDHILPHARGGTNDFDNLIIACAPCNYARMNYTLAEVGLNDPSKVPRVQLEWDGLERVLTNRLGINGRPNEKCGQRGIRS